MAQTVFSAQVARQMEVGGLIFALNGFLTQHCADSTLRHRGSIVIEELVVNAFWHGAAEGAGGVGVELRVQTPVLRGLVWHDGAPFDPGLAQSLAEGDALEPPEGGRSGCGLRIVQAFTSALVHSRDGSRNRVHFEIVSP